MPNKRRRRNRPRNRPAHNPKRATQKPEVKSVLLKEWRNRTFKTLKQHNGKLAILGTVLAVVGVRLGINVFFQGEKTKELPTVSTSLAPPEANKPFINQEQSETSKIPEEDFHKILRQQKRIDKIDQLIYSAEQSMASLEEALNAKIKTVKDPQVVKLLETPFNVMNDNKNNPHKNVARLEKMMWSKGISVYNQDPSHFNYSYRASKQSSSVASAFSITSRTLITPDIDEGNYIKLLYLYHELMHARQDELLKERLSKIDKTEEYLGFIEMLHKKGVMYAEPKFESEAFTAQIEVANLLLDGMLKEVSTKKIYPNDPEFVAISKKLGASKEDMQMVQGLIIPAFYYYKYKKDQQGIPKEFISFIARMYSNTNHLLFEVSDKGEILMHE